MHIPFRAIALIAVMAGAPGHARQAAGPEVQALVCDLSGDCAPGDAAAVPERGRPRASATRGFTFGRTAPDAADGAVTGRTAAPVATPRPRSADLHLDFASASAVLDPAARVRLGRLASALGNPRLAGRRVRIEGHTDSIGDPAVNRALSQRRAQAAADYLAAAGIARGRIEVVGYGSSRPLPDMPATAPGNRRVMATILN